MQLATGLWFASGSYALSIAAFFALRYDLRYRLPFCAGTMDNNNTSRAAPAFSICAPRYGHSVRVRGFSALSGTAWISSCAPRSGVAPTATLAALSPSALASRCVLALPPAHRFSAASNLCWRSRLRWFIITLSAGFIAPRTAAVSLQHIRDCWLPL
jgi:hypothetical protein